MRLVVAGDRLDPPIGIPDEIYELMLCCWNTESKLRPKFKDLVYAFETLLKARLMIFMCSLWIGKCGGGHLQLLKLVLFHILSFHNELLMYNVSRFTSRPSFYQKTRYILVLMQDFRILVVQIFLYNLLGRTIISWFFCSIFFNNNHKQY